MEDEKKKKRNKKKKNKQNNNNNKRVDDANASTGVTTSEDGNHIGDGDISQINGGGAPDASVESQPSTHQIHVVKTVDESGVENKSGASEVLLEETVKQLREENGSYLQKEAVFEETVRRLEIENEAQVQKEAWLEERLVQLRTENEAHIQSEAMLEEKLVHLRTENEAHIKNEALLEEKLVHLRTENEAHIQNEALLEEKLLLLRTENEAHTQNEALLEERLLHLRTENETLKQNEENLEERLVQSKTKIDVLVHELSSSELEMKQLLDERSAFTQKEASLEKKFQQLQHGEESSLAVEKSSAELISSLNNEIARLQAQVVELEDSRNKLLVQNQCLVENVSSRKIQDENHESNAKGPSVEDLNSEIEAACTLVEKLITENSELVEKVNELSIKLNKAEHASPSSPENLAIVVEKPESLEEIPIHDEVHIIENSRDMDTVLVERKLSESGSEEAVPVSLNPNGEIDVESQVVVAGEDEVSDQVTLVDSPLIGAPFRLVSFVARYVSGADLTQKK